MAHTASLISLTSVHQYPKWNSICDRRDISVKDGCIIPWMTLVSNYMRSNYAPECIIRLKKNLKQVNFRHGLTLEKIINELAPKTETTQKGDLAEAVCSLTFEQLFELTIPYLKWANKSHSEMPERGTDILAFHFDADPSKDAMYPTEVKWRKSTESLLQIIKKKKKGVIPKLKSLVGAKLGAEICFLLKKIENDKRMSRFGERIMDFLIRHTDQPKVILNATFFLVDRSVDIDECVKALTPVAQKPRKLVSCNHPVADLETTTSEIFRRISL